MDMSKLWNQRNLLMAGISILAIGLHFLLRSNFPLFVAFVVGGLPLIFELIQSAIKKEFGADLLAGISIITSLCLGEYLAGVIVIIMLSGGKALEVFATANASSVLKALAKRIPSTAHKKINGVVEDVAVASIDIGDVLIVYPHETCPVDGNVVDGHGHMDESYLTGEPFRIAKVAGSSVLSGSINGEAVLTVQASKKPADSRYAKIMEVMQESEKTKPQMRRLGDQLGAYYTPGALLMALAAWCFSGDPIRFLAVLVVATPCPLLIAIPIAIIGSISLAAKRAIIIKTPLALEQISQCRTAIFDKTGTLTYGEPTLVELASAPGAIGIDETLMLVASLEAYSKHPLASAILNTAKKKQMKLLAAAEVHEPPGQGLVGLVNKRKVQVTSRKKLAEQNPKEAEKIPLSQSGLECVVVIDEVFAALLRFQDAPRAESRSFVSHLGPNHRFDKTMIISGDRISEVQYLADQVGIQNVYGGKSPEEKLVIVREETEKNKTLYVGDGVNDAPAMMAATVGIAMGQNSEVTSEAAAVVILDNSLKRVDEFIHISQRMRTIVLQSAIGGMVLSIGGMCFAALGYLTPVNGAIAQEIIDILAIVNALRVTIQPKILTDFRST